LGVNAASGFAGNLLDLQVNGTSKFNVGTSSFSFVGASAGALSFTPTIAGTTFSIPNGPLNISATSIRISSYTAGQDTNVTLLSGARLSDNGPATSCNVLGGSAFASAVSNLNGGPLNLEGGAGAANSAGTANGGNINLNGGQAFGTGTTGNIIIGATRGNLQITNARNVVLGTTTGTKFGTATDQKLGFYNATPVVQPTAVADITTTATAGTLPTPDGTVTIADATTPTVTELLEYCVELESKLEAALGHLRTLGLIAT
jgi:hypothetical protein